MHEFAGLSSRAGGGIVKCAPAIISCRHENVGALIETLAHMREKISRQTTRGLNNPRANVVRGSLALIFDVHRLCAVAVVANSLCAARERAKSGRICLKLKAQKAAAGCPPCIINWPAFASTEHCVPRVVVVAQYLYIKCALRFFGRAWPVGNRRRAFAKTGHVSLMNRIIYLVSRCCSD